MSCCGMFYRFSWPYLLLVKCSVETIHQGSHRNHDSLRHLALARSQRMQPTLTMPMTLTFQSSATHSEGDMYVMTDWQLYTHTKYDVEILLTLANHYTHIARHIWSSVRTIIYLHFRNRRYKSEIRPFSESSSTCNSFAVRESAIPSPV